MPEKNNPITQELLEAYLAIERAAFDVRRVIMHAIDEGRQVEPGPLDVNIHALAEPIEPLVINQMAAEKLRRAARESVTVEPERKAIDDK